MKNALFSVVFPRNITYLDEFVKSICCQSISDFDVVIMNDGVDFDFLKQKLLPLDCKTIIVDIVKNTTPSQIREIGIEFLIKKGYQKVVFIDSDDLMSDNRIEISFRSLENYPIVFNDISTISSEGKTLKRNIWANRLVNTEINKEFLIDKNVIGLGNSAVRIEVLKKMKIPKEIIATDWFIFSKIMKYNSAFYVNSCTTLYRQTNSNIIGFNNNTSLKRLLYILKVKELHYASLNEKFSHHMIEKCIKVRNSLSIDKINIINNLDINFFWWEEPNYL